MAASQDTALQINYKLPDGTLVNVYAKDQAHLEALLTSLGDVSSLILATSSALGINNTPVANIANMQAQLGAVEISADKVCKHGSMTLRSGTGAKGAWKGWFCPSPKGTPDQCQPVFVR
jgi:lactam utilization protein B